MIKGISSHRKTEHPKFVAIISDPAHSMPTIQTVNAG